MRYEYRTTRESWIPKHAPTERRTDPAAPGAEVHAYQLSDDGSTCYALAFSGNRQRPDWHFSFRTPLDRERYIVDYFRKLAASAAFRAERKAENRQAEVDARGKVAVGQIYSGSWGYDQTQVEFWEVVDVRGAMATLRACSQRSVDQGDRGAMSDHCLPESNDDGRTIRRRIGAGPCFRVSDVCTVSLWDGRPEYRSWYA